MAEYLITSGVRVPSKRAVPDFCIKRAFQICRTKETTTSEKESYQSSLFPGSETAATEKEPNDRTLSNDEPTAEKDSNLKPRLNQETAIQEQAPSRRSSILHGKETGTPEKQSRRKFSLLLSNDSSQMHTLLSPGCDQLLKAYRRAPAPVLPPEDVVIKPMSKAEQSDSGYCVSEADATVGSESESEGERRRNLRYLLSLIHYAGLKVRC